VNEFGCRAYQLLEEAAELNHPQAMDLLASAHLFGDHVPQNMTRSRQIYEHLASLGYPQGQRVSIK
jgi:SEL1 protein